MDRKVLQQRTKQFNIDNKTCEDYHEMLPVLK